MSTASKRTIKFVVTSNKWSTTRISLGTDADFRKLSEYVYKRCTYSKNNSKRSKVLIKDIKCSCTFVKKRKRPRNMD